MMEKKEFDVNKIVDEETKKLGFSEEDKKKFINALTGIDQDKLKEEIEKQKNILRECYNNLIEIYFEYLDWKKEHIIIAALWTIGTYFHENFPTYPYLFLNATKSSGKTRAINLITYMSKDGEVLNSLTEAVLFRTKGTLGIDEFESIERKGKESLRELLNTAYKRGAKVKRLKKVKEKGEEKQVVEEFDVYRPIIMANIYGIENILADRCIYMQIDRSYNESIINLLEIFKYEEKVKQIKTLLNKCSLVCVVAPVEMYKEWNEYIKKYYIYIHKYINNTNLHNNTTNPEFNLFFNKLKNLRILGRELELAFPLLLIASEISNEVFDETCLIIKELFAQKREDDILENRDISLFDFISQKNNEGVYESVNKLAIEFKEFLQTGEDWINSKWMGNALKRLGLIVKKRRLARGVEVILNIPKAQNRIRMFKEPEQKKEQCPICGLEVYPEDWNFLTQTCKLCSKESEDENESKSY